MKTKDGELFVIAGASRSGKTWWTSKKAGKARRVVAWDVEAQWCDLPGWQKITNGRDLFNVMTKHKGPGKFAYVAGGNLKTEFDKFCAMAMYWARYLGPCSIILEEVADVSTPAKAPDNYGVLLRRGLKRGATIYAISQRWAEADKTAIGNASKFVIFRTIGDDTAYMARKTSAPVEKLSGLKPLQFVIVDASTGKITASKLK